MEEVNTDNLKVVPASYNDKFLPFFESDLFYKILWGSAGSSKSYSAAQKIVLRCVNEKGHRVWCFRKVSTFVEASVFDTLKTIIKSMGLIDMVRINKTDKVIIFPHSDCVIKCSGLDEEEKIKSISRLTIAWVEEATEFSEQDINQIDLRMRGDFPYYKEMILTFNPISELHWIKRKYFDDVIEGVKDKLYILHSTFEDNYFLDDNYKERLREVHSHDPNNYRVYVLGLWGKVITGMEYYKNFRSEIHVKPTSFIQDKPTHITFDFNVVPYMAASLWQIFRDNERAWRNKKGVWVVRGLKEIALRSPKNNTEDVCDELLENYEKYLNPGVVLYGDATGRRKDTRSKKTDWSIIENKLYDYIIDIRVPKSNPVPSDKNTFMNRMFHGSFPIECEINPEMKLLIEDLTHCLEDGERKKLKSRVKDPVSKVLVEKFGHFTDGMDYLFMQAFKDYL